MLVGLTGGIGSGKSTVSQMFRELGVPVYDSDSEAKKLMHESAELKMAIQELFGAEAYQEDELNRAYIAKRVFGNPEKLNALNQIVHPAVRIHFMKWAEQQNYSYVVQESALIFEIGNEAQYDAVILVTAPEEVRLNRVLKRDKTDREAVLKRIHSQLPDEAKTQKADYIIENLELHQLQEKVSLVHGQLLAKSKESH